MIENPAAQVRVTNRNNIWKVVDRDQKAKRTQADNMRLEQAMRELGWGRPEGGVRVSGKKVNGYVKGHPPYPLLRLDSTGTAFEVMFFAGTDEDE